MKNYLEKSMSFDEYVKLIDRLLLEGKTTGPVQSDAMFNYGRLNRQRMQRLEKTIVLEPETVFSIRSTDANLIWLVITEGWCGDAAAEHSADRKNGRRKYAVFERDTYSAMKIRN